MILGFGSQVQAAGEGISAAAKGGATLLDAFNNLIADADDQHRAALLEAHKLAMKLQAQVDAASADINKALASHQSIFVAGARPFILWGFGTLFMLAAGVFPLIDGIFGTTIAAGIELGKVEALLYGVLGFGGLRTAEKWKGVARSG